jgi:hypothetical protein
MSEKLNDMINDCATALSEKFDCDWIVSEDQISYNIISDDFSVIFKSQEGPIVFSNPILDTDTFSDELKKEKFTNLVPGSVLLTLKP